MSSGHPPKQAAQALAGVAPLISRWMDRLLAENRPPLTTAQYLALRAIDREAMSGGELAQRTGVSGPAVSQLLSSLADAGLIERQPATEDRRRHRLSLSGAGKRCLGAADATLSSRLGSLLQDLPKPEADALARALPRVEAALSGAPVPRRPTPPHPKRRRGKAPGRPSPH